MGVKIVAQDLEKAIAGSSLFVARTEDDIFIPYIFFLTKPLCDKP